MSPTERWFAFREARFERVHAHGAATEIAAARVIERDRGALRFIDLALLDPGAEIAVHTHAEDNEELYVVVSGRGLMTLDGQKFEVGPGDVVLNRPGGAHGLRNVGDQELRIVVVEVTQREVPR